MLRLQYSVHAKLLQSCPTLCDPMDCSPRGSSVHGDSPGKNTGVGSHFLLHGIFPTQLSYVSCIGRQILHQYSINVASICTGKPKKKKSMTCFIAVLALLQWPATQLTVSPMSACTLQRGWWGTSAALVRGVRGNSFVKGAMGWHLNGATWMEYFMGQKVNGTKARTNQQYWRSSKKTSMTGADEGDGRKLEPTGPSATQTMGKGLGFSLSPVRTLWRVLNKRRISSDF